MTENLNTYIFFIFIIILFTSTYQILLYFNVHGSMFITTLRLIIIIVLMK